MLRHTPMRALGEKSKGCQGTKPLAGGDMIPYTPPVARRVTESSRNAVLAPSVAGRAVPAKELRHETA